MEKRTEEETNRKPERNIRRSTGKFAAVETWENISKQQQQPIFSGVM